MSNNLALNLEKIKKEKDGLDVLGDIYIHAVLGEKIPKADIFRLQWYGLYTDESQNSFKLKIPLNMGELNLEQLKVLAHISKEFTDNSLTFSSEQKIEFKNIKIYNLPTIFNFLNEVNLTTFFESGHTVRRVATCPLNGIDSTQIIDVSDLVKDLDNAFIGKKPYSNMPNKLQFALSGYEEGCNLLYTPDVSFNASFDEKNKIIFKILICGEEFAYVYPSQVLNTAKSIAKTYRDFASREDFDSSSFESFINSWGLKSFFDLVDSTLPFNLKKLGFTNNTSSMKKPRMGINESAVKAQSYIGCVIENKNQSSENIFRLTTLLEKHGASKLKITHKGNIIILDVPKINAEILAKDLEKINFNPFV